MKTDYAFWDTSAIVPLCCRQDASQQLRQLRRSYKPVVSCITEAEAASALNRLRRENALTTDGYDLARRKLEIQKQAWREILFSDKLRELAKEAIELYDLRTLDALQFASGLIWCWEKPRGRVYVCSDARLRQAAQNAGFIVVPV